MPKKSNKKRNDGRIAVQVYLGTVDGKRKYKTVYGKTQKEAEAKADEIRADLAKGIDILSGENKTFEFWAKAWLKKMKETSVPEWYNVCKTRTQIWLDYFSNSDISKLNTCDLESVIIDIKNSNPYTNKPSSRKTLIEYKNVVLRIFDFCIQNRVIVFNPASYISIPNDSKKSTREPLNNEQIKYFWETPNQLQTAALIMIYAGLRRGELLALTWNDVDLQNNIITVNKAINLNADGLIKSPKTEAGYRQIPIPKILAPQLIAEKKNSTSIYVCNRNGVLYTNSTWGSAWRSYIKIIEKKYNISLNTSAHCLRHTYCTLLYEAGVDVMTAKELMGHSDVATTMGIYTHLRTCNAQKNIAKLDDYLSGKNSDASQMQVNEN